VTVEDDGLVRVCLAHDDATPNTSTWGVAWKEVSYLLTETDLYDFI